MEPSFVGMFIGWFFQKFMVFFVHQKRSKEARSPKPKVSNRGLPVVAEKIKMCNSIGSLLFLYYSNTH
jgi:hypothetical protein